MHKYARFSAPVFISLALLGAGCARQTVVVSTPTPLKTETPVVTSPVASVTPPVASVTPTKPNSVLSCGSGLTKFIGTNLDVSFCYPSETQGGEQVTVMERASRVDVLVGGVVKRTLAVFSDSSNKSDRDEIASFLGSPEKGYSCAIETSGSLASKFRTPASALAVYHIIGEDKDGTTDMMATDSCNNSNKITKAFGMSTQPIFYFLPQASTFYAVNAEQDPSLGEYTDDFLGSIGPKG